jgi:hypothetical protein
MLTSQSNPLFTLLCPCFSLLCLYPLFVSVCHLFPLTQYLAHQAERDPLVVGVVDSVPLVPRTGPSGAIALQQRVQRELHLSLAVGAPRKRFFENVL